MTTNTALTPADFNAYCVTTPVDPRIPGGGGYPVCGNFDVTPAKFGQAQTLVELASKYGEQFEHYNGIDVTIQARVKKLLVSGGMNTGRTETNDCAVVTNTPQVTAQVQGVNDTTPRTQAFCDLVNPWRGQTQVKVAAIYTFAWAIQTSMTLQSYPGQPQLGSSVYSNAQIAPSLGRNFASCGAAATCSGTSTITFEPNYSEFEDRYNQFDIRFAKEVKVYKTHVQGIVDLFNAFNARPVLALTTRYSRTTGGSFLSPTSTLVGRLIKFSAQINFKRVRLVAGPAGPAPLRIFGSPVALPRHRTTTLLVWA